MSKEGNFFVVGKPQWQQACKLGINEAVALLVMAMGTGRDSCTTSWSAKAVETRAGMGWRRANDAIRKLINASIMTIAKSGARPRYKIALPADQADWIWLPNEIVLGAGNETPPIMRIKQARDPELLAMFVDLYGEHDLLSDGGLPRSLVCGKYDREEIATHGQFVFYGFTSKGGSAWHTGPFARYPKDRSMWPHLDWLIKFGMLETIEYLAESSESDSELIHALTGDECARKVYDAAQEAVDSKGSYVMPRSANYDFVMPVFSHLTNVAVVGVYRLRYRPKTARTATWLAQHTAQCEQFAQIYAGIFGEPAAAEVVHLKANPKVTGRAA